jgi:ABC-2 type transport system permease protein
MTTLNTMKSILVLVRKDLLNFRRDRAGMILTFLIPLVLIVFFGKVFGVGGKDPGKPGIPLAVVNESTDPLAAKFVDALRKEESFALVTTLPAEKGSRPLIEADLRPLMQADKFHFALVLPADAISDQGFHVKYLTNPNNRIETEMVSGLLQKTAFTGVPQLFGHILQTEMREAAGNQKTDTFYHSLAGNIARTFGGDEGQIYDRLRSGEGMFGQIDDDDRSTNAGSAAALDRMLKKFVHVETEQVVGADVKSPQATQMVGGWAIQFLLFAVTSSAAALFAERERGLFQRILSGPTRRSDILWSKFLFGVILGLIQLLVLFWAGHLLFNIEVAPYVGRLVLVCLCAAGACTSFGMLIASVASSQEAARGFSTLVILLMSAIGGAWFPISLMPQAVQNLAHVTLVYWAIEGFQQVLWAHAGLAQILPTLSMLVLITALVMAFAAWRFARGAIFD